MKSSYTRYYRRNPSSLRAPASNAKDSQKEPAFFAAPSEQRFFKPGVAVERKCDHCEAEEKAQRMAGPKEDEKKVQRMPEKKEEMAHKKEEKELHRAADKKEDKELHRAPEHKEEKELHRSPEKKEDDKVNRAAEQKEEELHRATDAKDDKELHRKADMNEEEKTVAKKESAGTNSSGGDNTASYIKTLNGKGQALPEEAQSFFGKRMGYDFSHVKIHTGSEAEQSAREVNAKAYAVDNNIVFNKGQYNPSSPQGKTLLAHELTHVVQQNGHGPDILNRVAKNMGSMQTQSFTMSGHASVAQNKRAYGCEGLNVEGHTDANFTDNFKASSTTKPSTKCTDCDASDCVDANGSIVSTFKASPVITLPAVPDGLSDCETAAATRFINGTLKRHEQQHVKAFNTYNATINTPYKFTGCKAELDAHAQAIHDAINNKRLADANAKSDALDPFNAPIPCDCK